MDRGSDTGCPEVPQSLSGPGDKKGSQVFLITLTLDLSVRLVILPREQVTVNSLL